MNSYMSVAFLSVLTLLISCENEQQLPELVALPFNIIKTDVGQVNFPNSCNSEAAPLVERGVALLHHMMYAEAGFIFGLATKEDDSCALAYWGQAMVFIHPLWPDVPSAAQFEKGTNAVRKSLELKGKSERENLYLETTRSYYENTESLAEGQRLVGFEQAWKKLSESYPEDLEARAFYSLALRAIADPRDPELSIQKQAGAIAEDVLAKNPTHPGAHHYIIHAYDIPGYAELALATADNYGKIAGRVPHATHMMTHIYTRLGQWEKAIKWNKISADSAWELCLQSGEVNSHLTHGLDYLAYAYLQTGADEEVLKILLDTEQLELPYSEINQDASAYAFAAMPARYALERQDWVAAAALQPRMPSTFPWQKSHDSYVAITHFARALAMARLNHPEAAEEDIAALRALQLSVATTSPYWAQQIEIQEKTALAWQTYSRGNIELALDQMRQAAEMEASTDKHGITPGEVLPASELYGDMLTEAGRHEEALAAYQTSLARTPLRYNSLFGAGNAAHQVGDELAAKTYFGELLAIAGDAKSPRDSIQQARKVIGAQ